MHKNTMLIFFVQYKTDILLFWHVVILLLLCNNKNKSSWHNSFKSPKQKFGVTEKNFIFMLRKK